MVMNIFGYLDLVEANGREAFMSIGNPLSGKLTHDIEGDFFYVSGDRGDKIVQSGQCLTIDGVGYGFVDLGRSRGEKIDVMEIIRKRYSSNESGE